MAQRAGLPLRQHIANGCDTSHGSNGCLTPLPSCLHRRHKPIPTLRARHGAVHHAVHPAVAAVVGPLPALAPVRGRPGAALGRLLPY